LKLHKVFLYHSSIDKLHVDRVWLFYFGNKIRFGDLFSYFKNQTRLEMFTNENTPAYCFEKLNRLIFIFMKTSGLCYKSYAIIIYNRNDCTIVWPVLYN